MINRFSVPKTFDLRRCVCSGQVFRWHEDEPELWFGVDGEHWYQVEERAHEYAIESNANLNAFVQLFDLECNVSDEEARLLAVGPELKEPILRTRGLRLMKPSCPVEAMFSFLCTSNNHIARITPMVRRLSAYGETLDCQTHCRFPDLAAIARIQEFELRTHGFGYRAATIPRVAAILLDRYRSPIAALQDMPDQELRASLASLPGIGPKLADCIMVYAFHRRRVFPVDTHVWHAAAPIYFPDWPIEGATERKKQQLSELLCDRFGDLAARAQQILFADRLLNSRASRRAP